MPTVNALFSHQISVIMGDFLYSTALTHLVGLGDLAALQAFQPIATSAKRVPLARNAGLEVEEDLGGGRLLITPLTVMVAEKT